jgi:alpha-glucosidase
MEDTMNLVNGELSKWKSLRKYAFSISLFLALGWSVNAATVSSPDGRLILTIETTTEGTNPPTPHLVYQLSFRGKLLVEPSALRLDLEGQPPLGNNMQMVNTTSSSEDHTYKLVTGKASQVRDHYNALRVDLREPSGIGRKLTMEARAYDDAVAFRYSVPEQNAVSGFRLIREGTEFRIAKDATAYALVLPNFRSGYESEYIKLPITAFGNQGGVSSKVLMGLPLLMEVPGVAWMGVTEANLRDYSSMYLTNPSGSWAGHWFESVLAPSIEDPDVIVKGTLPHSSAWRVFLVGDEPGRLVESNVIASLNPESEIADTSWIHAGRASWDWWNGSRGPDGKRAYTTETMKYYVDFAAKSGFEYMMLDAGWSDPDDVTKMNGTVDVPELVRYAKEKGVKVWIWLLGNQADRQMDEAFPLYEKWGVAGLKIDFILRDDQHGMNFYYRAAKKAAEHHLMVDFHGTTKPSGIERTYPNILSYEAVLGMENSKVGTRDNPEYHTTIPFTRMLAGPMDQTPGAFDNRTREEFTPRMEAPMVMGTRAHQLAMYVVFQCAFQMVSDVPYAYDNQPAFQFIKDAPATWDETRVLNGRPGVYITVARRHGNEWFLGSLNNWDARQLDLPLDFLGPGNYTAEIYSDANDAADHPKNVRIERNPVTRSSHLQAGLASGGGYAVRFVPAQADTHGHQH